ncbi:MAG TPA: hypothetical protein VHI98_11675 [Vicinamibacterales bacterium]|jgi:hypothetical protein|nr:hypothetical protein [Vicinamibacterales bacterium]
MLSSAARSSGDSSTRAAAAFSSTRAARVVPGMGMTSGPRDSSQASASCAEVQRFVRDRLDLRDDFEILRKFSS